MARDTHRISAALRGSPAGWVDRDPHLLPLFALYELPTAFTSEGPLHASLAGRVRERFLLDLERAPGEWKGPLGEGPGLLAGEPGEQGAPGGPGAPGGSERPGDPSALARRAFASTVERKREHRRIARLLDERDRLAEREGDRAELVHLLKENARGEEEELFPLLARLAGALPAPPALPALPALWSATLDAGLVDRLRREHGEAGAELERWLDTGRPGEAPGDLPGELAAHLRRHIEIEERLLFPAVHRIALLTLGAVVDWGGEGAR